MAMYLVYHHDGHVCKHVSIHHHFKVLCHTRFFSPPMCDVKTIVVDPAVWWLSSLAYLLLAVPPASY